MRAATLVEKVLGGTINRDIIRTERVTDEVLAAFGITRPGPKPERSPEIHNADDESERDAANVEA